MRLRVLLPFDVFADVPRVSRIVAEAAEGSFGLLPRRLDCVASLVPGILVYDVPDDGEVFLAIDEGVLVKTGATVTVSVRRAIRGRDLAHLQTAVAEEFLREGARHASLRAAMVRLESSFVQRLAGFQRES